VDIYTIASLSSESNEHILRVLEGVDMFNGAPDGDWVRVVAICHDSRIFDHLG
jgi:hypothetical protein